MSARNAWLSWKRVKRVPADLIPLVSMTTNSGQLAQIGVSDDPVYPALYVGDLHGDTYRISIETLVQSVLGSAAREADVWEPLVRSGEESHARCTAEEHILCGQMWGNTLLSASRREHPDGYAILSYHWRDRAPIRDWRVGQRAKNEMCGEDWEAIEVYPSEDRLMDEANEYWLFAFPPDHPMHTNMLRLGYPKRSVMTQAEIDIEAGGGNRSVQRDDDGSLVR